MTSAQIEHNNKLKSIACYLSVAILSLVILSWVMKLWNADLRIPFNYSGDTIFGGMSIKGMIENGWYLFNPRVGAPTGLAMYDYMGLDFFHQFLLKLISFSSNNFAEVMNIFFILTFPLTALASYFSFRQFKVSYPFAITGSMLITFIPFHLMRGEGHLFLASYYAVPLTIAVFLWLNTKKALFFDFNNKGKVTFSVKSFKRIASIIIVMLIATTGVYYAIFAIAFLFLSGLTAALSRKNIYHVISSVILIFVIIGTALLTLLPNITYIRNNKKNEVVAKREWIESEIYALRITQLLLPITGHRIEALAKAKSNYNKKALLVNENDTATLGAIGSIGFLFLLAWLLFRKSIIPKASQELIDKLNTLSVLNAFALLMATLGGGGVLFNAIITPQLRCYNRVSVYIAIFSIFALILVLNNLYSKYSRAKVIKFLFIGVALLILVVGILDQTTSYMIPPYAENKIAFENDAKFIKKISGSIPKDGKVFQLPFVPFPENPPVVKMTDYDHFKAYLHSKNITWSYGAIKGREGDKWNSKVAAMPVKELLKNISLAGFDGIYVDRFGYEDSGVDIEKELSKALNTRPISSSDARYSFFDIRGYRANYKKEHNQEEWKMLQEKVESDIWQKK